MREGRANGGADGEGGGSAAVEGIRRWPKQPRDASSPPPSSSSSSSCAAALASCGRREAEEEGQDNQGGGKKQGRRKSKRREVVARAIRDRLPAAPSCWGNVSVVQGVGGRRGRSRRERPGDDGGAGEDDCGAGTTERAPAAAWCCVCPAGDCALEPNPSANGKEDAGLRSLIELNDFYSDDCNPHADVLPAAAAAGASSSS